MHIKSPTRIDFSGGTLDCYPLYNLIEEPCYTINLSINIFTEVYLSQRADEKIMIEIENLKYQREFSHLSDCIHCEDEELSFLKPHLKYWSPTFGFHLKTLSGSPVGGGLGGSSSLCMSLIKAFAQTLHKKIDPHEMVHLASNMEAHVLKTPTGTQDYYPAIQSGLNLIEYALAGPQLRSLDFDKDFFQQRMLLVYTGQPHHSGLNNWQIIKAAVDGETSTLKALSQIAQISMNMLKACQNQQWEKFPSLFEEEFQARLQLSPNFVTPEIEALKKLALNSGAEAVKICGAGGGGCVMVWLPPEKKPEMTQAIQSHHEYSFKILDTAPFLAG